jgi:hypothetical protein
LERLQGEEGEEKEETKIYKKRREFLLNFHVALFYKIVNERHCNETFICVYVEVFRNTANAILSFFARDLVSASSRLKWPSRPSILPHN